MAGLNLPIVEPPHTFEVAAGQFQVEADWDDDRATMSQPAILSKRAWLLRARNIMAVACLCSVGVSAWWSFPEVATSDTMGYNGWWETTPGAALASPPEGFAPVVPAPRIAGLRQGSKGIQASMVAPRQAPQAMSNLRRSPVMQPWTFNPPAVSPGFNAVAPSRESQRSQVMTAGAAPYSISNHVQPGRTIPSGRSGFFGSSFGMFSMLGLGAAGAFVMAKGGQSLASLRGPRSTRQTLGALQMVDEPMVPREPGLSPLSGGGFSSKGEPPKWAQIRGFSLGTFTLFLGLTITFVSFYQYFSSQNSLTSLGFIYGLPIALGGFALKYAEINPVPVDSDEKGDAIFEAKANDTLRKVKEDVTRHRYGDEAHLELALEKLGLVVEGKGFPQMMKIIQRNQRGELAFTMEFQSKDTPFKTWADPQRIRKYETFFGGDLNAEVIKVSKEDRIVAIKLTTGEAQRGAGSMTKDSSISASGAVKMESAPQAASPAGEESSAAGTPDGTYEPAEKKEMEI